MLSEEGRILVVFLYQAGRHGYSLYKGTLPLGLDMTMKRSSVRALLGAPQFAMEATTLPRLGRQGPFDRYDRPTFCTGLDYDEMTEQILTVSLMLPVRIPAMVITETGIVITDSADGDQARRSEATIVRCGRAFKRVFGSVLPSVY